MDYIVYVLIMMALYGVLAVSLDLAVGHTGLVSIAHASFYGMGAYATAICCGILGVPWWVGVLTGMTIAAAMALILAFMSLRLSEDYFVIGTFGFGLVVSSVFNNWLRVTRGPFGIPNIPPPVLFGWSVRSGLGFLVLALALLGLTFGVVRRLTRYRFGRVIHCIREDEILAESLGWNTLWFKVAVFAIGSLCAAAAGSLYAHYMSFVDPTGFSVMDSILILSMVIVGGPAGRVGALIGAIFLVGIPEVLRFVGMAAWAAADVRQIIFGASLVAVMLFRPRGLAGAYEFKR